jgi:hypothetical protein
VEDRCYENRSRDDEPRPVYHENTVLATFSGFAMARAPWMAQGAAARPLSASFGTISIKSAASLFSRCDALVPLEIPSKAWPCTFVVRPALLGGRCASA